jgi:hypothetical protein
VDEDTRQRAIEQAQLERLLRKLDAHMPQRSPIAASC